MKGKGGNSNSNSNSNCEASGVEWIERKRKPYLAVGLVKRPEGIKVSAAGQDLTSAASDTATPAQADPLGASSGPSFTLSVKPTEREMFHLATATLKKAGDRPWAYEELGEPSEMTLNITQGGKLHLVWVHARAGMDFEDKRVEATTASSESGSTPPV